MFFAYHGGKNLKDQCIYSIWSRMQKNILPSCQSSVNHYGLFLEGNSAMPIKIPHVYITLNPAILLKIL